MAPVRLRHPKGVTTLQLDFDSMTVQDMQQQIFGVSEIPPSQQEIRSGYPPQSLTIIPELPLSSLGLKAGEQIIVNQKVTPAARQPSFPTNSSSLASRPPQSSPPQRSTTKPTSGSSGPDSVETSGGVLVHRIVPDDNSCLFSSVAIVFEQDIRKAQQIRKIVADGIRSDMETYNEAILGQPRDQYIATILKPSTWGGAIELGVLAKHYGTEIASIDVETGRIDRFEPPPAVSSGNRCVLVYSGIHYDAASLAPMSDAPPEWHQTVFPIVSADEQDPILVAAKKLADILRSKKAFTNTSTFDLKCEDCGKGLKGEKDARAHAQETGHVRFGEY
ncbi:OTU-domain-containing protein [Leucogyrophana mollusca]|uniref:OTU-domain-containing protein n=1 Tax=Leucogyrophana mollusca TaxID=85980 RepID=A0ACB8BUS7_9AGAM|nr:OTU-domain-containing protein [Leucogyrophana mollusca]